MPAVRRGAGRYIELVAFSMRELVDDGYGNEDAGDWAEQFQTRAEFIPIRASEVVMAGRLENRETVIMTVRKSADTMQITAGWQATDVHRGVAYNINSLEEAKSRADIELLATSGGATG